jgi:hypothetical protein
VPNTCLNIFPAVLALCHEPRKIWACNGNVCAHLVIQVIHILVICDAYKYVYIYIYMHTQREREIDRCIYIL